VPPQAASTREPALIHDHWRVETEMHVTIVQPSPEDQSRAGVGEHRPRQAKHLRRCHTRITERAERYRCLSPATARRHESLNEFAVHRTDVLEGRIEPIAAQTGAAQRQIVDPALLEERITRTE
jgi:hypothetical protein